jgi:predicted DNA-binding WGR domain protein
MRRFELVEGSSSKFWEIELSRSSFTVRWDRIGTAGQSQVKDFDSDDKAKKEHDKLVTEKLKKGYSEVASDGAAPASTATNKLFPRETIERLERDAVERYEIHDVVTRPDWRATSTSRPPSRRTSTATIRRRSTSSSSGRTSSRARRSTRTSGR